MKVYDDRTGRISDFYWESNLVDLKESKIHDIRRDREGNFWLAVYQRGVLMLPMQANSFKYIGYKSGSHNIIGSKSVTAFWKGKDDVLYVGTDNDGLYVITPGGRMKAHYRHTDDPHSVPSIVINLFEDSRQTLWIGSFASGLAVLDKQTGRCNYLPLKGRNGKPVRNVYAFAEDKRHKIWIATMGGGLFCYDMDSRQVVEDSVMNERVTSDWICSLHYSARHDRLYVGSYNGLFSVDLEKPEKTTQKVLPWHIIHCLHEDEEGNLWAGTAGGLACWNRQDGEWVTYTTADGLCSNSAYAIQSDGAGDLWVSTSNGLSCFHVKTRRFVNYYAGDEVQGNEFCKNASFRDKNGILWFGGINGITYFNPKEIISPHKKWTPRITDFYLYDCPVRAGTLSGGSPVIDGPVFDTSEFRLSWPDNSFSIEFATQELNSPERITFLYAMENDKWIALPQGTNRVSFTKLAPGTYRFRLKTRDYDVESDVKEVVVRIAPPWWRTGWAYAGYGLLALAAVYLAFRMIRRHYRVKQEMLQHAHAEQINEAKMQLFINIAHEIRTPMSLIINPLRKLMQTDADEGRQREYRIIRRNSDRILRLVNDLLDVRNKPFNMDILKKTIENLIRSREQLRNIFSGDQQASEEKLDEIRMESPDDRLMERIMKSINRHLSEPELTVETIAAEVGLSRSHLHRKLKELTNQTTRDFLRNLRLKQAATLLAEKRHSVSEVALLVGFSNASTFSTAFREQYGISPSDYREQSAEPSGEAAEA